MQSSRDSSSTSCADDGDKGESYKKYTKTGRRVVRFNRDGPEYTGDGDTPKAAGIADDRNIRLERKRLRKQREPDYKPMRPKECLLKKQ